MKNVNTYVLSYNCPKQFEFFLQRMRISQPAFFDKSNMILCNQSDDVNVMEDYEKLCKANNIENWVCGNNGCSGGRVKSGQHFAKQPPEVQYMFYFEDDQPFNDKEEAKKLKGYFPFPYHIDNAFDIVLKIMESEKTDYVKLAFSEAATDHTVYWPRELAPDWFSKFTKMQWLGVGYLIGEVFYSNWASCISREGNEKMFSIDHKDDGEYSIVKLSHELIDSGQLRACVLMATLVMHTRKFDYDRSKRFDIC